MFPNPSQISEINKLETMIVQIESALSEAAFRFEAIRQRGPLLAPSIFEWSCYVNDLENQLKKYLSELSIYQLTPDQCPPP